MVTKPGNYDKRDFCPRQDGLGSTRGQLSLRTRCWRRKNLLKTPQSATNTQNKTLLEAEKVVESSRNDGLKWERAAGHPWRGGEGWEGPGRW